MLRFALIIELSNHLIVMRYGFLVLVWLVSLQAAGQDTVFVQQVNSPLLIDRTDNVLVRLRVKVDAPSMFRGARCIRIGIWTKQGIGIVQHCISCCKC